MWTHYAAGHTGLVIGFDAESALFLEARQAGKLKAVDYRLERPSLTRELGGPDVIFTTKSKDWEYEYEWRWLERGSPFDYANVVATPTGELLFLRPIPASCICEVVLGCRIGPATAESVQAFKSTPDYAHLRILKATLNRSRYQLDMDPI